MKALFRWAVLLGIFALAVAARAQTITAVTATIADPNGIPYSFAPVTINLAPSPGTPSPTIAATGAPVVMPINPTTNSAGAFSVNLIANGSISSAGSTYTFRVCVPPVAPPIGTGAGCVTITGVTIAGASQDLSATFAAVPPPALANVTNQSRLYNIAPAAGTASIGATTMVTAPAQPATGTHYVFSFYATQTVLGTSCTGNTTVTVNAIVTDPNAAAPQTTAVGVFTVTTNGTLGIVPLTSSAYGGNMPLVAKAGTIVQFSTTYALGTACAPGPTVQLFPTLELQ